MKLNRLICIGVIALLLGIPGCSGKKDKSAGELRKEELRKSMFPEIKTVSIEPANPDSGSILRAQCELLQPEVNGVQYTYRWYVNKEEVDKETKKLLTPSYFKRGDQVYCDVVARQGKYPSKKVTSQKVTIANAPPKVNYVHVPPFQVPGQFKYTIDAQDPDEDLLSYKLLQPLDQDIDLDPETGVISWYIRELPRHPEATTEQVVSPEDESPSMASNSQPKEEAQKEKGLTPTVTISFEVSDSNGGTVVGSVTINLMKGREIPR